MNGKLTRRQLLKYAAFSGMGIAAAELAGSGLSESQAQPVQSIKRGGTFRIAKTPTIVDFNPFNIAAGHAASVRCLYNSLAQWDDQRNLKPDLAEKWQPAPDGKSITIHLRPGVRFHNGREVTSEDVKFSAQFAATDPSVYARVLFGPVEGIDTPDKYTVVLKFKSVYASMLELLDILWVLDKDSVKTWANKENGTGPFVLDKYIPNDRAEFVPFKDYFEVGKPYLDRYISMQVPDQAALSINLESGAVDAIWRVAMLEVARFKAAGPKWVVYPGAAGQNMIDVALNVKWGPFANKKVRQAMAWSIDRARFCRTTYQGLVEPSCLMVPSQSWGYFKDLEGAIGYDLDKARALLKEAGYENGFACEIMSSANKAWELGELAQILQADLKKIGVNASVTELESARYDTRMNKGDIQMMVHNYAWANRDPGILVNAAKAWYTDREGGWCHFEGAEYEQLRRDVQSTMDPEKRKAIFRKLQELVLDECFTIPVASQPMPFILASHVRNFRRSVMNQPFAGDIWLDK